MFFGDREWVAVANRRTTGWQTRREQRSGRIGRGCWLFGGRAVRAKRPSAGRTGTLPGSSSTGSSAWTKSRPVRVRRLLRCSAAAAAGCASGCRR